MTNYTRRTWIICPEGDTLTTLRAALTYLLGRDCSEEVAAPWGPPGGEVTHRVSSAQMTWAEVGACLPGVSPGGPFHDAGVRVWAQVAPGIDDLPGAFVSYRQGVDLDALPEGVVAVVDEASPVPVDALHPRLRWSPSRIESDRASEGLVPWEPAE
jgi:hypothetical protein